MSLKKRLLFSQPGIRLGGVALFAIAVQIIATQAPLGDDLPRRILIVASYALLFPFVAANLRFPGIAVLGVGLLLNFLPIIANEGLMPVTPQTLAKTGYTLPQDVGLGDWVPHTKDVLLEREDTRLWFLTDRFAWGSLPLVRAFSPGDVFIAAGLLIALAGAVIRTFGNSAPPNSLTAGRSPELGETR